jgi:putative SOS response-associated peptidase YedK
MCGRYTLTVDKSTIEHRFGAKFYIAQPSYDWSPTFNAAPSQMLPIIRTYHPDRIELERWGFCPEEWKRNAHSRPMINARPETAAEKPMFSSSFIGRHCLVLADGYYEWRQIGKHKHPFRITLKSGEPFAMAGIYAREPTEFDTAERTQSTSPSSRPRQTKQSPTSTTACRSSCRSAVRSLGCHQIRPACSCSRASPQSC